MRSPAETAFGRRRQRGFTLIEVMTAGVILSVFVMGLSALWQASSRRVDDLTLKQKAVFVVNAEMERLTALYGHTNFGYMLSGNGGPVSSTGYSNPPLAATRLVYPSSVDDWVDDDFVTTSFNTFRTGSEFLVFRTASDGRRNYVWIDRARNVAGRLSWTEAEINILLCASLDTCSCHDFDGSDGLLAKRNCRKLELFLEYPYRPTAAGAFTAPARLQTMSLQTIVGRLR